MICAEVRLTLVKINKISISTIIGQDDSYENSECFKYWKCLNINSGGELAFSKEEIV